MEKDNLHMINTRPNHDDDLVYLDILPEEIRLNIPLRRWQGQRWPNTSTRVPRWWVETIRQGLMTNPPPPEPYVQMPTDNKAPPSEDGQDLVAKKKKKKRSAHWHARRLERRKTAHLKNPDGHDARRRRARAEQFKKKMEELQIEAAALLEEMEVEQLQDTTESDHDNNLLLLRASDSECDSFETSASTVQRQKVYKTL